MTKAHGSNVQEKYYENGTKVVYVAVELRYDPPAERGETEIDIRQGETTVFPRQVFDHPGSGWEWYALKVSGGFADDARFTTTVYADGRAISLEWETRGQARTPDTGGDV
jgi:hypothetical protein